jgi:hypothetical protein
VAFRHVKYPYRQETNHSGVVTSVEEVAAAVRRAVALLPNQPSGTSRLPARRSHADLGASRQRLRCAGTPPRRGGLRQRPPSRRGPPSDARTARSAAAESPTGTAPAPAIAATRPISAQCSRRSHLRRLEASARCALLRRGGNPVDLDEHDHTRRYACPHAKVHGSINARYSAAPKRSFPLKVHIFGAYCYRSCRSRRRAHRAVMARSRTARFTWPSGWTWTAASTSSGCGSAPGTVRGPGFG